MLKKWMGLLIMGLSQGSLLGKDPVDVSAEIAALLKGSDVPSMAVAMVREGEFVATGAWGIRKEGDKTVATVEDKYHLGSCTKSMTATLGAILIEEGKLKWEATVEEVFKKVKIHDGYQGVTFEQLVTNVGGVPGDIEPVLWGELWEARGSERHQRMQLVEGILEQPPAYSPGSREVYSNAGFSIAGAMLEEILDQSYEDLMEEKLFKPLGMESAGFRAPAKRGEVDQPYGHVSEGGKVQAVDPEPLGDNPAAIAPAGAVHCSVGDFAKYALMHLGGGKQLVSKEALDHLHTAPKGENYAKGWLIMRNGVLAHEGSNTMFHSIIVLSPKNKLGVVALCNFGGEEGSKKCNQAVELMMKKFGGKG